MQKWRPHGTEACGIMAGSSERSCSGGSRTCLKRAARTRCGRQRAAARSRSQQAQRPRRAARPTRSVVSSLCWFVFAELFSLCLSYSLVDHPHCFRRKLRMLHRELRAVC
eukprot:3016905-Rhodomonas_salina.2